MPPISASVDRDRCGRGLLIRAIFFLFRATGTPSVETISAELPSIVGVGAEFPALIAGEVWLAMKIGLHDRQ